MSKVLQIFNRYLEYGGEEGSVDRIAGVMRERFSLQTYLGSTEEALEGCFGKLRMPLTMRRNPKVLSELRRLQQEGHFDVWQVHNVFPAVSVAVYELAEELRVPVVQYLHNYRFGCPRATLFVGGERCTRCLGTSLYGPALLRRCWRDSLPATASMAFVLNRFHQEGLMEAIHCFIAISECQKRMHVEMGIPEDRICVLPHFLDADERTASESGVDDDVLFIGRITEEKGLGLLLRAWSQVDAHGRILRIVGDGPDLPAMRRLAEELELQDVVFEGFVPRDQHGNLWRRSSFFVAPSVWMEPFGMVILEAWKHGKPVLATNLGSFPELITPGVDGWLADADPLAFAGGLQAALDAGSSCVEMGKSGRVKLEEQYNRTQWLDRIDEIYREMKILPK